MNGDNRCARCGEPTDLTDGVYEIDGDTYCQSCGGDAIGDHRRGPLARLVAWLVDGTSITATVTITDTVTDRVGDIAVATTRHRFRYLTDVTVRYHDTGPINAATFTAYTAARSFNAARPVVDELADDVAARLRNAP